VRQDLVGKLGLDAWQTFHDELEMVPQRLQSSAIVLGFAGGLSS